MDEQLPPTSSPPVQATPAPSRGGRLDFIDDARGLAVVLMIFWHTVHGWIDPDVHAANPFVWDFMRVFGGTAAPMFVALAGVGAAIKLHGDARRAKSSFVSGREMFARGMDVLTMGYALRIYTWTIDDRALLRPECAPAFIPIILGLFVLLEGWERLGAGKRDSLAFVGVGGVLYAYGVSKGFEIEPSKARYFFKVDVLQAIGGSLAVIGLLVGTVKIGERPLLALVASFAVGSATDPLATRIPESWPAGVAAYFTNVARPDMPSLGAFPMFPWLAYALFGLVLGRVLVALAQRERQDLAVFGVGAVLAGLAAITNGPPMHQFVLPHAPWLYKSMFMVHKVGIGFALLMVLTLFVLAFRRSPVREMGQTSMVMYWVHLEFAYGVLAKPLKHRLGYGEWAVLFVLLTVLMAFVARARLRLPEWIAARSSVPNEGR